MSAGASSAATADAAASTRELGDKAQAAAFAADCFNKRATVCDG